MSTAGFGMQQSRPNIYYQRANTPGVGGYSSAASPVSPASLAMMRALTPPVVATVAQPQPPHSPLPQYHSPLPAPSPPVPVASPPPASSSLWKFEFNDLSEIARHSVLQSGFPPSWKEKALGRLYYLSSVLGNDVRKTRLSDIRVAFRFETYHSEVDFLDDQLNSLPRVPRAMKTLEEEQAIVDMDLTQTPGAIPDPELEHYVASLRRNEETRLSAANTPRTQSVRSSGAAFSEDGDKEETAAADDEEEEEEDAVRIEGNIDVTTMKKFMLHDIKSFEHRIRELSTYMLMLAGSNDTMSKEINAIVQNRALMEAAGATTKIRGNLVGKEPSVEDASIKSGNLASSTPGPEVWVHEECHPAAAEESDSERQSETDHK